MSNEPAAPETKGISVELLAELDLGPEIEDLAGRQLRMRKVTFEPRGVFGPIHDHKGRHRLHPARNGHRPSQRSRDGLWAGTRLARGQQHHTLAREQRNDPGGGGLGRYRQATVSSAGT